MAEPQTQSEAHSQAQSNAHSRAHAQRTPFQVRRVTPGEWRELRALRLEALDDAPSAFSTTRAASEDLPDTAWKAQTVSGASARNAALFVAVDPGGAWLGMAGAAPIPDVVDHAHIHGVYVTPAHRGPHGPAAELVAAAVDFARRHIDVGHLTLGVHEANVRAQAFYRRVGFEPSGLRVPYVLNPDEQLVILRYPKFRDEEG
ncbi:GNAT family N-acetyltransferase [Streptacidiphilus fuscans]|uniref:GNAT family N-acetyltransferase n=1 Tax=Streptacidiphilus fuscans TaxID=2789292 RepID=A0A931BC56_9ACTN|nr:GNAT family N-acetyltransferase [Streptacidiphilus fuscans]MBF9071612.1 GNAT family N-acetyltransferase [Streptacidiphilus fuscans]MBF9072901.1 GNAT family N-acetyltransferase [Streptacidiphilus fuscans]